jgi:hypothetical protein
MVTKRIVCLANSRKLSGRCIAGKENVDGKPGGWVRPVSDREHEEVSELERRYEDGSDPKVLDLIDVPLIEARAHAFQRENWLLDPQYYWQKAGQVGWTNLQSLLDPVSDLWINGQSTFNGLNDKVDFSQAAQLQTSLRLIHVNELSLEVCAPGAAFGNSKRRVQGRFKYAGTHYHLWVTDPVYERRYLAQANGRYEIGECCLTISLGEPHEGFCYKLIAAVVERADTEP